MTFLHPWAIAAGALALGAPVLIHYLTRPRPLRVPLSTLRFVREAVEQKRARYRLRDWIVLILRTLAVALIAIAFARPLLGSKSIAGTATQGNVVRVVMLDQSLSMAASAGGVSSFERGRAQASNSLVYQNGVRANLILASAQARPVFERVTSNFDALREELAKAKPRTERMNLQAAINAATEVFAGAGGTPDQTLELVMVSDFQRSNWASADFGALPKPTQIRLESVAPKQAPANFAVLKIAAQGRAEQNGRVNVAIDVGNYSTAARNVEVELSLGAAKFSASSLCPPNVSTMLTTDITLPEAGWQIGEVKLLGVEDALGQDNSRPFVLNVRPPPTYALLTREPSAPRPSSSHYLERALVPVIPREPSRGAHVVRIDPAKLDRDALGNAELIVIDHPGRLTNASTNLLAALLRRGRSVLYVAAEPVDATNLKMISDAAGADMKLPVEFLPPAQARRDLFIVEMRRNEAPFAALGERLAAAIQPLRFGGGLGSKRSSIGLIDDVLAWYSDRSAAIVVSACGSGNLAILNADLNSSNLPGSNVFVPLLEELIGRVLARDAASDAVACGESLARDLPAETGATKGLEIVGPDPKAAPDSLGSLSDENGFVVWHWPSVGAAGAYQVKRGDKTIFAQAAAAPASESDLATIDPSLLTGRLAGGRSIEFHAAGAEEEKNDSAWAWAVAVCAIAMMMEFAVLRMFRT